MKLGFVIGLEILQVSIERVEVEKKDLSGIIDFFNLLIDSNNIGKQSVMLTFDGYDDIVDEIYEISPIREYVSLLFTKYPFMFYYLSNINHFDKYILACLCDMQTVSFEEKRTVSENVRNNIPLGKIFINFKPDRALFEKIKIETINYAISRKERPEDIEMLLKGLFPIKGAS